MDDLTFTAIRPILPYVAPNWTVEIDGDEITGDAIDQELADHEVEIIGGTAAGYDVVISVMTDWGDTYYFLANR